MARTKDFLIDGWTLSIKFNFCQHAGTDTVDEFEPSGSLIQQSEDSDLGRWFNPSQKIECEAFRCGVKGRILRTKLSVRCTTLFANGELIGGTGRTTTVTGLTGGGSVFGCWILRIFFFFVSWHGYGIINRCCLVISRKPSKPTQ